MRTLVVDRIDLDGGHVRAEWTCTSPVFPSPMRGYDLFTLDAAGKIKRLEIIVTEAPPIGHREPPDPARPGKGTTIFQPVVVVAASCCLLRAGAQPVVAGVQIEAASGEAATADKWAPLRFLLGTWEGTTNPKGETHEDVGYINHDRSRKAFVLRQFHVEGFVNTYVSGPNPTPTLIFTSEGIENIPSGWRARETYRVISDDEFVEVFELAEPGKEFMLYSEAHLKRRK